MVRTRELWERVYSSVCYLQFARKGAILGAGTAFRARDFLITNNHVFQASGAETVKLGFVEADGHTSLLERTIDYTVFRSLLVEGDLESGWDYAILACPDAAVRALPGLELALPRQSVIGASVAALGFHFDQRNLAIQHGTISSQFVSVGVDYLQLAMGINNGNSGGPLIDMDSGAVIGIVTRKATGLSHQFAQLVESFEQNTQFIQNSGATIQVGSLNTVDALIATQRQLQRLAREIERSANVGIGYAYSAKKVLASLDYLDAP